MQCTLLLVNKEVFFCHRSRDGGPCLVHCNATELVSNALIHIGSEKETFLSCQGPMDPSQHTMGAFAPRLAADSLASTRPLLVVPVKCSFSLFANPWTGVLSFAEATIGPHALGCLEQPGNPFSFWFV
ncbi:unnamed protein product [Ostreobium quekettii]|uniref:Uncharacterized protein n=1 Tax=Ostreobium quekettii TaxID=121088 RepID=A0A8S1IQ62_9CHLO|nr:unnamed protein product [Ostreobium quekettii]